MNVFTGRSQAARERAHTSEQHCIHCGKAVRPGRGTWVEITIHGEVIPAGDPRSGVDNVSLGGFVLGSDCARKLRRQEVKS